MNDTQLDKLQALALVAALAVTTLAVSAHDLYHGVFAAAWHDNAITKETIADGRWARGIETYLAGESDAMRMVRPYWNEGTLALFGETPQAVVAGRGRWLFSAPSLAPIDPNAREPGVAIMWLFAESLRDLAASNGSRFECYVVPSKWRIHGDRLHRRPKDAARLGLYSETLAALSARGIDAPNLLEHMREREPISWFPPNDTHLDQNGVRELVATLIAPRLGVSIETARRRLREVPEKPHLHSGNLPDLMSIRPESAVGRAWSCEDIRLQAPATLDRPDADVILLGDSHSKYHDFLLGRLITVATGLTVDARRADAMSLAAAQELARDVQTSPPQAIVFINTEQRFGGKL